MVNVAPAAISRSHPASRTATSRVSARNLAGGVPRHDEDAAGVRGHDGAGPHDDTPAAHRDAQGARPVL